MRYRKFGRIGWEVSALGFGCMRFPTLDGERVSKKIDEKESTRMIRHAIDNGVNYLDTAYGYHGGRSEVLLSKVLRDGYRDKVRVATKSPIWLIEKGTDFDIYLDKQLRRMRTDHVDFYLFHGLNRKSWTNTVLKRGLIRRAEKALREGKIGHIGFSFHDDFKAFKEIVDGYDGWSFCQIQYNYMDTENQAGTKGLKYAASRGLGVIVMEPLLGGRLSNPPPDVKRAIREFDKKQSPSDIALQWIWDQPEVSLVLSGMSTMRQVRGNLRSANASGVGSLDRATRDLVSRIKKKYKEMSPIPCTKCGYCMPCPNGVDIPRNFEEYNDGYIHGDVKGARAMYQEYMSKKVRANACVQCGECEEKCPQKIKISQMMPKVHEVLGENKPY